MKNAFKIKAICKIAGITVILALIGFSLAACGDGTTGGSGGSSTSLVGKTFAGWGGPGPAQISFTATNYTFTGFGEFMHSGTYKVTGNKVTLTVTKANPIAGAKVGDVYTCTLIDENTLCDDETGINLYRI